MSRAFFNNSFQLLYFSLTFLLSFELKYIQIRNPEYCFLKNRLKTENREFLPKTSILSGFRPVDCLKVHQSGCHSHVWCGIWGEWGQWVLCNMAIMFVGNITCKGQYMYFLLFMTGNRGHNQLNI